MLRRKRRRDPELSPDEIFLDASNIPEFDRGRLEGRLEQPLSSKAFSGIAIAITLITLVLIGQAVKMEIVRGASYAAQSQRNVLRPEILFATRGVILDRNGVTIAGNKQDPEKGTIRDYLTPGFSHLTGYVAYPKKDSSGNYYDTTMTGLAGIEASFNTLLAGENGQLLVEEDASGKVQSQGTVVPPKNGSSLTLSIDVRAQQAFMSAIGELADRIGYQGGAGILMDIHTGQVLALVSYPEYDPNILANGTPSSIIAGYSSDTRLPYLDRAVSGLYTPGSIVKAVVAAGALSDKIISPDKIIVSTGSISVPNPYDPAHPTVFPDWKALGPMDIRGALAFSSDVYFYTIGGGFGGQKGLGIERLAYWYNAFGYQSRTGIEVRKEGTGFVPTPAWKQSHMNEAWNIGDTYHTSIGQYAMQVTPLEAVRADAAIANGGQLVHPSILKDTPPSGVSIAVDPDALRIVREGMREDVTEGTAIGLNTLSFTTIAAKTGTAQVGAQNQYINAWITGFFPYQNPQYAFAILMDRGPGHNTIGGVYAAIQALTKLHQSAPEYFQ